MLDKAWRFDLLQMSKEYRLDLRANRDKILEDLREKYGLIPPDVERLYLRRMIAIQNNTRGKLGELLGEVSLTSSGKAKEEDIIRDVVTFSTPFGKRRIDVWHTITKHALEIKSGYACLNKFTRNQIRKDKFLLSEGIISHVSWRLMYGGSHPLIKSLQQSNFEVLEGWPNLNDLNLDRDE